MGFVRFVVDRLTIKRVSLKGWVLCLGAIAPAIIGLLPQPVSATDQIVEIRNGRASLHRNGRRYAAPVGTRVLTGDWVRPSRGAIVKVRCQDGGFGERTRLFGLDDVCPNSTGSRYSQRGRGEDDFLAFLRNDFEYASQVLIANPIFRWNSVAETTRYRLQLLDCGQAVFNCGAVIWSETVEGTEIRYGGEALTSGRNYQLTVTPIDIPEPLTEYLTLRRLEEEQLAAVQMEEDQLTEASSQAELGAEGQALALAQIYLDVAEPNTLPPEGTGLVLEAIPTLEAVAAESETPYTHRLLGDAYLEIGLLEMAKTAYETVLALSVEGDGRENRAAAQVGLANIAVVGGDREQAEVWLQQARVNYALLGERDRKEQVEQWLGKLSL